MRLELRASEGTEGGGASKNSPRLLVVLPFVFHPSAQMRRLAASILTAMLFDVDTLRAAAVRPASAINAEAIESAAELGAHAQIDGHIGVLRVVAEAFRRVRPGSRPGDRRSYRGA